MNLQAFILISKARFVATRIIIYSLIKKERLLTRRDTSNDLLDILVVGFSIFFLPTSLHSCVRSQAYISLREKLSPIFMLVSEKMTIP